MGKSFDTVKAALQGSSFYRLPKALQWFKDADWKTLTIPRKK